MKAHKNRRVGTETPEISEDDGINIFNNSSSIDHLLEKDARESVSTDIFDTKILKKFEARKNGDKVTEIKEVEKETITDKKLPEYKFSGNQLFVDPINGDDKLAVKNSKTPFKTVTAATAASKEGDIITLDSGKYDNLTVKPNRYFDSKGRVEVSQVTDDSKDTWKDKVTTLKNLNISNNDKVPVNVNNANLVLDNCNISSDFSKILNGRHSTLINTKGGLVVDKCKLNLASAIDNDDVKLINVNNSTSPIKVTHNDITTNLKGKNDKFTLLAGSSGSPLATVAYNNIDTNYQNPEFNHHNIELLNCKGKANISHNNFNYTAPNGISNKSTWRHMTAKGLTAPSVYSCHNSINFDNTSKQGQFKDIASLYDHNSSTNNFSSNNDITTPFKFNNDNPSNMSKSGFINNKYTIIPNDITDHVTLILPKLDNHFGDLRAKNYSLRFQCIIKPSGTEKIDSSKDSVFIERGKTVHLQPDVTNKTWHASVSD